MTDPLERVRTAAAARGLDIELRERPAASSLAEAASLLGLQPADIVKTLVVKKSDDTYLFALIPGDLAISWPKLRALVGVNKLRLPEPELALAATGYERGTIVPIGSANDWPVYADASIVGGVSRWVPGHTATACSSTPTTSSVRTTRRSPTSPNRRRLAERGAQPGQLALATGRPAISSAMSTSFTRCAGSAVRANHSARSVDPFRS